MGMGEGGMGKGRVVIPFCLATPGAQRRWSGQLVRARAARSDARSLGSFSAGPTGPTCPTNYRKVLDPLSVSAGPLWQRSPPPLTADREFCFGGRTDWPGWTCPSISRVLISLENEERRVDRRRLTRTSIIDPMSQVRLRLIKPSAATTLRANPATSDGRTAPGDKAAS